MAANVWSWRRRREKPKKISNAGVRGRGLPAADRAGQAAGVDQGHRRPDRGDLRGAGRGRQGRHDQADHRVPQPAGRPDRRAAQPDRAGARPVVLPALHRPPPGQGRDRHLRPLLVQPRRRRAGDGLLHRRGVRPVHDPDPDLRADADRRRDPAAEVLVLGLRRRAAEAVPVAAERPGAAVEAEPDGPGVDQPLGGLLAGQGRDDGAHRHPRSAPGTSWSPTSRSTRG